MTQKPKPLLPRVAKLCGETTLHPDACWQWGGALSRYTPTVGYQGKVMPARRALYLDQIGPLDPWEHVKGNCSNLLCVNPHHTVIDNRLIYQFEPDPGPNFEDEPLSIDDIIDLILATPDRDAETLATKLGEPLQAICDALARIETERL